MLYFVALHFCRGFLAESAWDSAGCCYDFALAAVLVLVYPMLEASAIIANAESIPGFIDFWYGSASGC